MSDVVNSETRSRMMSAIRGKDTKPEMVIRKGLHALGFRYRLHVSALPGNPDVVFPKHNAVIEVNGCFWHAHGCHLFKWPDSREDFWREKLTRNKERDRENIAALRYEGWRVLVVWECALKGKNSLPVETVVEEAASWLHSEQERKTIRGKE